MNTGLHTLSAKQLGELVRSMRQRLQMTQKELAGKLEVAQPIISMAEKGEERYVRVLLRSLDALAEAIEDPTTPEVRAVDHQPVYRVSVTSRALTAERAVRVMATGLCELCRQPAPFEVKGDPYLEVHHIKPLAAGGNNDLSNMVALCPNCHALCRIGDDREKATETLYKKIKRLSR